MPFVLVVAMPLTMTIAMPNLLSRRVQKPAMKRMKMVIGMAAMVRPNSGSLSARLARTINCTVKPRKKKKSNLRRAM